MRPGHSELCDSDDCPCFTAGEEAARLSLAEAGGALVEAMTRVVEILTPLLDPEDAAALRSPDQGGETR